MQLKKIIAIILALLITGSVAGCVTTPASSEDAAPSSLKEESAPQDASSAVSSEPEKETETVVIERPPVADDGVYSVLDFGTPANGTELDSPYVQEAADMVKEQGGGTIVFPAGTYLLSSVRLYDNTTVIIEKDAEILVSSDEEDYVGLRGKYDTYYERDSQLLIGMEEDGLDELQYMYLQGARGATDTVFFAHNASNIKITGEGTINGQWQNFYNTTPKQDSSPYRWLQRLSDGILYGPLGFRPQIIYLITCHNVEISGISIIDAPFFNVHMTNCQNVVTEDLTILADIHCVNTDGININNSKNCEIRNCEIQSGDDCVALSGDINTVTVDGIRARGSTTLCRLFVGIDEYIQYSLGLGSKEKENRARLQTVQGITIQNCEMELGGAFLLGYAAYGTLQNITIDNNKSYQESGDAGIFLCVQADGTIRDINISNFECESTGVLTIMGNETTDSVRNITVRDSNFIVNPTTKIFGNGMPDPVQQYYIAPWAPYNFYVRHASNVTLENVNIQWGEADLHDLEEVNNALLRPHLYNTQWRTDMNASDDIPAIDAGHVAGLTLTNVTASGFGEAETVRLRSVTDYLDDNGYDFKELTDIVYE